MRALAVNRDGASVVAEAAAKADIPLIHLSTDYVFDGPSRVSYKEDDTVNPQGSYATSKEASERAVRGALLATPLDFESPLPAGYPTREVLQQNGWLPTPCARLPFASIVAASTNDPLGRIDRVAALAQAWGSRLVNVGAVGHLNPASGYGTWLRAQEFIGELAR